jgi:hypothetical protein
MAKGKRQKYHCTCAARLLVSAIIIWRRYSVFKEHSSYGLPVASFELKDITNLERITGSSTLVTMLHVLFETGGRPQEVFEAKSLKDRE